MQPALDFALQYAAEGFHMIPIEPGGKRPSPLLDHRQWKWAQESASTPEQIQDWSSRDPNLNWGVVCARDEVCGDCDDGPAAAWILANPQRPLFQGACVVRSGSGRAHIWFRADGEVRLSTWPMVPGRKMGEIRARGSYVLVPPSRLESGGVYQRVAGTMHSLPLISDPVAFLQSIVDAFLAECPDTTPAPDRTSKRILQPSKSQLESTISRVRDDKFKKKILDTLFIKGHQTPGALNWTGVDSHSEIDFGVCCEFYRKGWAFADVEVLFAGTLVGEACYRNTDRSNHGQGYLLATWEAARASVEKDRQASSQPQGANFRVAEATLLDLREDKLYTLVLEEPLGDRHTVRVTSKQLSTMRLFQEQTRAQARFFARFNSTQHGDNFDLFAEAVDRIVSRVDTPPQSLSDQSFLQTSIRRFLLGHMVSQAQPETQAQTRAMGWRTEQDFWVRTDQLVTRVKQMHHGVGTSQILEAMRGMAPEMRDVRVHWPDAGDEIMLHLRLPPAS